MPKSTITREDFHRALLARFEWAAKRGEEQVTVRCGDLHGEVNPNGHSPAVCSGVMWVETTEGDCTVLYTPPSGTGPRLEIRYRLPRQPSKFGLRARLT